MKFSEVAQARELREQADDSGHQQLWIGVLSNAYTVGACLHTPAGRAVEPPQTSGSRHEV
ncbi:MAG TPA: hypothetical protein VK770_02040 [Candidatus Acidoferrum sp.]|nr:hypothetical protein [Candidatus Acidoferrum sp.]